MKYLALVLAEEKKQYAVRLETLALEKSSNNQVFQETSKDFEKLLLSDEFKEQNEREKSKIVDKAAAWATSVSKLNSFVKRLFDISLFILSKEYSPSSAALLFLEKSFASCVIVAILKFAANAV